MFDRIPIQTPHGTFEVRTRRGGTGGRHRMLTLHGGPGATHEYLEPLEELAAELIFYDQLGSSGSDQPDDARLWTIDRFVDEVEQVRAAYELDQFVLYGHSWGAILALEYALVHGPRLEGLVLSNMPPSTDDHNRLVMQALGRLGLPVDAPERVPRVFAEHMLRVAPWPEPVQRAFSSIDPRVSSALRGSDPLLVSGRLATWDRRSELHRLTMPTLVLTADHDLGGAELRALASTVPHGRFASCPNGSHLPMWDDREAYLDHLRLFLDDPGRATA